jgi:adenylate kinase
MAKIIFFLGKPGSGKGTQINYLEEETGFKVIRTGDLLRGRAEENDHMGKKIKECLDKGGLIPTPVVFILWMPLLIEFEEKNIQGVIFDNNPRKLYEAKLLEEVFNMFEWGDVSVVYLKISDKEAHKRLLKRKRSDDTEENIRARLDCFQEEVMPVINFYQNQKKLIEINGEQSTEDVFKEIEEKTKDIL